MNVLCLPMSAMSGFAKVGRAPREVARLLNYKNLGGEVHVLNLDTKNPTIDGLILHNTHPKSLKRPFVLSLVRKIIKICKHEHISLIRVFEAGVSFENGFAASIAGKLLRIPVVVSLHNSHKPHPEAKYYANHTIPLSAKYSLFKHVCFTLADKFLPVTDFLKSELPQISQKKATVLPNFVDTSKFLPSKEKDNVVLYIGRLVPYKGIDYLIRAFELIKKEVNMINCEIIGAGDYMPQSDSVVYKSPVSNTELPAILSRAKVFLTASLIEGFGITVIEAQSCKVPVVAFNIPPFREITSKKSATLVPFKDEAALAQAVIEILNNPSKAKLMGEFGRDFVRENFETKKIFAREIKLITGWFGGR